MLDELQSQVLTLKSKIKLSGQIIEVARNFGNTGSMKNTLGVLEFSLPVEDVIKLQLEDIKRFGEEYKTIFNQCLKIKRETTK